MAEARFDAKVQVHVVTVSYYSGEYLTRMLQSLPTATSLPLVVTVANNASGDHSLTKNVGESGAIASIVEVGSNRGYGGGVNAAATLETRKSNWILVTNPDLVFEPGAIDELVAVGSSDPSIGVVGPLIRTPSNDVYPSARKLPSLRTGIGHALFSGIWKSNPWTRSYRSDRESPPRERDAGWVSGACMLIRTEAFEAVGGFDEKFFMYFEDVDICARLNAAGWRVVYGPSAEVQHVGAHATTQVNREMVRAHHRSAYAYLASRYHAWYLWPLRLALRIALSIRSTVAKA